MNRHPFRWEALAFGLLFLAVVGTWTAWKTGALAGNQLAYAPAATLIVLGVAGIIATFGRPSKEPTPTATDDPDDSDGTDEENSDDDAADTQS